MTREDENLLDAYLDGVLDEPARQRAEQRLREEPRLRDLASLQRKLNESLQRVFAPPSSRQLPWINGGQVAGDVGSGGARLRPWAFRPPFLLAAGVLLAVSISTYFIGPRLFTRGGDAFARHPLSFAEVRESLVAGGFEPEWRCEVGPKFAMYVYHRLGQALLLANIPPQIEIMGWAYRDTLSPDTMVLLTRVDGAPTLVFIDRKDRDEAQRLPPGSGLQLHRAELNQLVLYELSSAPQPRVLEHFFEPRIEEGWLDISLYGD